MQRHGIDKRNHQNRERSPLQQYITDISEVPLLTADEEKDLARRIAAGDEKAREHMIRANLRLVMKIARGYMGRGVDLPDLISAGNLGLMHAVDQFDPTVGTRFSTYASYWIKQSIQREIMNTGKPIRLPAYMVTLLSKWQKTHKQLLNSLGRNPTNDEIATAMKLQREKIDIVLKALKIVAASHAQPTDEFTIEEKVVDEHESPEEIMQTAEDIEQLEQKLNDMDPREATVLRMRFGLNDQPTKTLEEVGKDAGLTRERVRQIQTKAISNLSKKMA